MWECPDDHRLCDVDTSWRCIRGAGGSFGKGDVMDQIPGSIVKAICAIQASLGAVAKSQRNSHGGYSFASTDDIYASLTRKMGEVGLTIVGLETGHEVVRVEKDGKTSQWLKAEYAFVLATEDATWSHKDARRSLYIQITGPQTHQAAQSYAEKAFLRSLFKLPTGDMDLDSMPQADNEDEQVALSRRAPRRSSAEGKRDGSVKKFNELRGKIAAADGPAMLMLLRSAENEFWSTMPRAWAETLSEDYYVKMQDFGVEVDPESGEMVRDAAE